jgi:hypothetical protein
MTTEYDEDMDEAREQQFLSTQKKGGFPLPKPTRKKLSPLRRPGSSHNDSQEK